MKGWIGTTDNVLYVLRTIGADQDTDGKFLIYGKPPASFLGIGEETLVSEETKYSVNGIKYSLSGLLNSTSYGLKVNVI